MPFADVAAALQIDFRLVVADSRPRVSVEVSSIFERVTNIKPLTFLKNRTTNVVATSSHIQPNHVHFAFRHWLSVVSIMLAT